MRFGKSDREQLPLIVPFVERLVGGKALVALQSDQRRLERGRQRLRGGGLADTGLTFKQQGLPEGERQEHSGRQALIDQVVDPVQPSLHVFSPAELRAHRATPAGSAKS